jgi:hypothetical protein
MPFFLHYISTAGWVDHSCSLMGYLWCPKRELMSSFDNTIADVGLTTNNILYYYASLFLFS